MTGTITVQMLMDVELTVDTECKVTFDQYGQCFIVHTDEDGTVTAQKVDYVKPIPAPIEEDAAEEVSEEEPPLY